MAAPMSQQLSPFTTNLCMSIVLYTWQLKQVTCEVCLIMGSYWVACIEPYYSCGFFAECFLQMQSPNVTRPTQYPECSHNLLYSVLLGCHPVVVFKLLPCHGQAMFGKWLQQFRMVWMQSALSNLEDSKWESGYHDRLCHKQQQCGYDKLLAGMWVH